MAKLFDLNDSNGIHHLILIDNSSILADDEYISIELNNFDWRLHAQNCTDCRTFLNSINNSNFKWGLESNGEYFLLDFSEFGDHDHFKNMIKLINKGSYSETKLKLKKVPINKANIDRMISDYENSEEYESCAELMKYKRLT